jgi:hypothetical protein
MSCNIKSRWFYRDPKLGMTAAYTTREYTLQQIAKAFGVHYANVIRTVSTRVKYEIPAAQNTAFLSNISHNLMPAVRRLSMKCYVARPDLFSVTLLVTCKGTVRE